MQTGGGIDAAAAPLPSTELPSVHPPLSSSSLPAGFLLTCHRLDSPQSSHLFPSDLGGAFITVTVRIAGKQFRCESCRFTPVFGLCSINALHSNKKKFSVEWKKRQECGFVLR